MCWRRSSLARRQRHRPAVHPLAADAVHLDLPGHHHVGRGRSVGAPQHRLHPGDQLPRRERLRDVVVRAELEAEDAVDLVVAGGEHDDGQRAVGADAPAHLDAVDLAGQAEVEDRQLGPAGAHVVETLLTRGRLVHAEAGVPEVEVDQVRDVRIVLDEHDRRRRWPSDRYLR